MPISPTYPGVYIEEVPSAVRTITGVPTSVTAFVGPAKRGSVNEPRHLTSWGDFERTFGGVWGNSLMSYAVQQYYLNGGSEAEVVRVVAVALPATFALGKGVTLEAVLPGEAGNQLQVLVEDVTPASATAYKLTIKDSDGNLHSHTIHTGATDDQPDSLTQQLAQSKLLQPADGAERHAKPDVPQPGADPWANAVHGTGGRDGAAYAKVELQGKSTIRKDGQGNPVDDKVALVAVDQGDWGNHLVVEVKKVDGTHYDLTIRDTDPVLGTSERFLGVETDPSSLRNLKRVLEQQSQLARVDPDAPATALDVLPDNNAVDDKGKVIPKSFGNGADGPQIDADELAGHEATKTGIYALLKTDIFNILCLPQISRDADLDETKVLEPAAKLCVDRRAMLLVDAPITWKDVHSAVDGAGGAMPFNKDFAKNAARYFPRILLPNSAGDLLDWSPCGVVAGTWARTDAERGVWKAPAGTDASIGATPTLKLTDGENGLLNPLGVNCLRTFPVIGPVLWGARTMVGADRLADQWKYVPVRRTALFIEESLYRGTQWVVFEPNDEPLWAAIRLNIGAFMNSLFRQGAFQGRTPQQAYLVKCDAENNPQNDIDRGIVNILVGFAPLKPAEFVLIHIQQLAGQLQT